MKFDYPEMSTVPVKGMRFYESPDGRFYPSITTVLGLTVPEEKKKSLIFSPSIMIPKEENSEQNYTQINVNTIVIDFLCLISKKILKEI